ncbi:MAG TPA: periplasmic heavy metal sensor [Thermoanaerobaculia bacterium]|nr:periplasmic heavy metal sensor [Thermoanaerobaculia bacterium]
MKRFALILSTFLCALPIFAQQPDPVSVIAHVLELSNDQVTAWSGILHAREAAIQPIAQQAQAKRQALEQALASPNPDPVAIGNAFIELRGLQAQVAAVNADSASKFQKLLDDDQLQRLEGIRGASQVCPIVPALQATGLM